MHVQLVEFAAALTLAFRNGSLFLKGVFQALEELSTQVMSQLSRTACRINIPAFKHNETASRRKGAEEGLEGGRPHGSSLDHPSPAAAGHESLA